MVDKLTISARSRDRYIKFIAEPKSMLILKKIVKELGSDYFIDNQIIPRTFSDYNKWKDEWIPIRIPEKNLFFDIICGDKYIHLVIKSYKDLEILNLILNKYCEWVITKNVKNNSVLDLICQNKK